ncbi:hypothetical protein F9U64_06305 [Gracilibacillus oryzae]|uniref:Uncharacterized protein n=1 Tax=Gracilibacillus oryzae TaxID=1672701 RepID=A0A7C8KZM3_9BACI|nr:hypothetical protein [Gracilibacillus oryzae]KAB8138151.1 hypothetical protein F9U64_06305 [Gracilibacillus oryzae]
MEMFKDTWNPTKAEIKYWAFSDEHIPDQDWELAIISFENLPFIISLAGNKHCKQTLFFLSCLYVFTGDIVRRGIREEVDRLAGLLEEIGKNARTKELKLWVDRSRSLIHSPENYHYDYWGLGSKYIYQ